MLKKNLLLLGGLTCATMSFAQHTEYAVQLNGGLMKFGGRSANKSTQMIHYTDHTYPNFTISPYGKKFGASYGASVQLQRVTNKNFLFGLQAGVESLRSRVEIESVYSTYSPWGSEGQLFLTSGHTTLKNDFINAHPYVGYRVNAKALQVDVTLGADAGFGLKSQEKGEAETRYGEKFKSDKEQNAPGLDFRPRAGVTVYYNHVGLSGSYAYGITSYKRDFDGANLHTYAQVLRLGMLYRL